MPKRLLILVAALAAMLVFAPTSSAQLPSPPSECASPSTQAEFEECLVAIGEQLQSGGGGGGGPEECQDIQTQEDFEACLAALAEMAGAPEECQTLIDNGVPEDQAGFEEAGGQLQACLMALGGMGGGEGDGGSGDFDDCREDSPGRESFFEECPDEDDGTTPSGGIDSGSGGTAGGNASSQRPCAALVGGGTGALALVALGTVALRRRIDS